MLTLVDALLHPRRCYGDCHTTLTVQQRTRAVEALYVLDDALRGWGYTPLYEIHGDVLWQEAQQRGDPGYRGVAVRFGECVYRRLEDEARAWLTGERVDGVVGRIEEAAARGRTTRPRPYPPAEQLAALPPQPVGRNDPCPCASGKKVKKCCGERAASGTDTLSVSGSR
jgi:hypothetical protein